MSLINTIFNKRMKKKKPGYWNNYSTWEEALLDSDGYDSDIIINKVTFNVNVFNVNVFNADVNVLMFSVNVNVFNVSLMFL